MTNKIVNLQEIAIQLEQTAKSVEEKVKNSDTRFNITAGMLAKKIPELKAFESITPIFQARWTDEGMRIDIPRVCKSLDSNEVIVQLPDLEYLLGVEYTSYVTGLGGYATIRFNKQNFQIGLIANLDLEDDELEKIEGEGIPPIEVLGYERRPEVPLKSEQLPLNSELIVVSNGKKSREYGSALCDVKIAESGEIVKNVICNSQLERLIERYGHNGDCKFKITKKITPKEGKKNWKVIILDLNGVDFSDLEI